MVSASTLPKADKNALLKARLLDASRRMRLGRAGISTQTDAIPTKLMKEVNIDVQSDLIRTRDVEILTDGTITLKQEGPGEFFLTHSVTQMTDAIRTAEAQTQTLIPRITHRFFDEYFNEMKMKSTLSSEDNSSDFDEDLEEKFTKTEKILLNQIKEIRRIDSELERYRTDSGEIRKRSSSTSEIMNAVEDSLRDNDELSDVSDDSLAAAGFAGEYNSTLNKTTANIKKIFRKRSSKNPKNFLKPTIASWNFEFSDDEPETGGVLLKRSHLENDRPWSSFGDLIIENHLANMKLTPTPIKKIKNSQTKSYFWNESQLNAIEELLFEANALLEVFEEMTIMLGPDIKLNEIPADLLQQIKRPKDENDKIRFPSEYWEPIVNESRELLDQKMRRLKYITPKKMQPISPDILNEFQ